MWKKENSHTLFVGMQIDVSTMENCMEIPPKIKNRTITCFSNSCLGIYPNKNEKH